MTRALFVAKSANAKTGPLPVAYIARESCPPSCAHYRASCYAEGGPVRLAWNRASACASAADDAASWRELCAAVAELPAGQLWRYGVAGDLPGVGERVNLRELRQLLRANAGRRGFTYTHKRSAAALRAVAEANAAGFTVNLSADNLAEADALAATGAGPVAVVLPADAPELCHTPAGRPVVVCPAQLRDGTNGPAITCATFQLCQRQNRAVVVGFRAHGASYKKADAIARRVIPILKG